MMSLQYISMGEKDFFDSETILNAHIYNENLKIPIMRPKIKVVESIWCDQNLREKGRKPMNKDSAQSKILYSGKAAFSGSFWAFS